MMRTAGSPGRLDAIQEETSRSISGYGWMGKLHTGYDWTQGCIAVANEEIDEIWTMVPNGTLVEIRP